MISKTLSNKYDYWIYPLYITIACAFTSGLNIVHTKYVLGLELKPSLFIVPLLAGVIFGYLSAKLKSESFKIVEQGNFILFSKYIIYSCLITSGLNIAHTEWVLNQRLEFELFIAPLIAGVFFGYLIARIKTLNNSLMRLATTDTLTQVANRMQFDHCLESEIEKVKRYGGTFSIIYLDVDHFKVINDELGHQFGDDVLSKLANTINQSKRKSDILARYGGDEFIILATSTNQEAAHKQAELLRESIQLMEYDGIDKITCSFGVIEFDKDKYDKSSLINTVDKALYTAKNIGRDRIVAHKS